MVPGYWMLNATVVLDFPYSTTDYEYTASLQIFDSFDALTVGKSNFLIDSAAANMTLSISSVTRATTLDTWYPTITLDTTTIGAEISMKQINFNGYLIHPLRQDVTTGI